MKTTWEQDTGQQLVFSSMTGYRGETWRNYQRCPMPSPSQLGDCMLVIPFIKRRILCTQIYLVSNVKEHSGLYIICIDVPPHLIVFICETHYNDPNNKMHRSYQTLQLSCTVHCSIRGVLCDLEAAWSWQCSESRESAPLCTTSLGKGQM